MAAEFDVGNIGGRVAGFVDADNVVSGFVFIRTGTVFWGDGETSPYIQTFVVPLEGTSEWGTKDAPEGAPEWGASDSLETEDLEGVLEELESRTLDWYGEILRLTWLDEREAELVRSRFGGDAML
jgi:hypothetical protein